MKALHREDEVQATAIAMTCAVTGIKEEIAVKLISETVVGVGRATARKFTAHAYWYYADSKRFKLKDVP